MYSAVGGGPGYASALVLSRVYKTVPSEGAVLLLCPLVGSMVYSLFIADWPGENGIAAALPAPVRTSPGVSAGLLKPPATFCVNLITIEL